LLVIPLISRQQVAAISGRIDAVVKTENFVTFDFGRLVIEAKLVMKSSRGQFDF
jgi:hypothetical protein